jgi:hypothetical protein
VESHHHRLKVSARQLSPGGLIFGLIRMRSSTFINVRINTAMQITDVKRYSVNYYPNS